MIYPNRASCRDVECNSGGDLTSEHWTYPELLYMITHSLVTAPHSSSAICRPARRTLVLSTINCKLAYTFSGLPVVRRGDLRGEVGQRAFLSFRPRPRAPVYFGCSIKFIYSLEMNPGLGFQIYGQSESAAIGLPPHYLAPPILSPSWPKGTKTTKHHPPKLSSTLTSSGASRPRRCARRNATPPN